MLTIGNFARLGEVSPRMLRHYDEIGLLRPDRVDPTSGYRYYSARQLAQLHRILALRDLGFHLDQIARILDEDLSTGELRGMLRLRRAQIEANVETEQGRLRLVEAHLHALEGTNTMDAADIVIKRSHPIRMAEAVETAPGYGPENMKPVFGRLLPEVLGHLDRAGAKPGISVAYYDWPDEDGRWLVHAGFDIGDQDIADSETVRITELPAVQVASALHRGPIDGIVTTYEALVQRIDESGYRIAGRGRELYHEWHQDDPSGNTTELQMPIAR